LSSAGRAADKELKSVLPKIVDATHRELRQRGFQISIPLPVTNTQPRIDSTQIRTGNYFQ